jgi:hypothetical protein
MIWLFSRGDEAVRLETRFDNHSQDYILEIAWMDRPQTLERFRDLAEFKARLLVIEDQLSAEHWTQVGGPEILPHGWRGPIPH